MIAHGQTAQPVQHFATAAMGDRARCILYFVLGEKQTVSIQLSTPLIINIDGSQPSYAAT